MHKCECANRMHANAQMDKCQILTNTQMLKRSNPRMPNARMPHTKRKVPDYSQTHLGANAPASNCHFVACTKIRKMHKCECANRMHANAQMDKCQMPNGPIHKCSNVPIHESQMLECQTTNAKFQIIHRRTSVHVPIHVQLTLNLRCCVCMCRC